MDDRYKCITDYIKRQYSELINYSQVYEHILKLVQCVGNKNAYIIMEHLYKALKENIKNNTLDYIYENMTNENTPKCLLEFLLDENYKSDMEIQVEKNGNADDILDYFNETFEFRENQLDAINNTKLQNFLSGIHVHIMGAGKTAIILNLIYEHFKINKTNGIYIICTYRKEILDKMFYTNNILDKNKVAFWKKNNIIRFGFV